MNMIFKVLLGICVICLSVACSGNFTDAQYVERAQGHLDRGELKAASIELKNALQQNQKNAQARMMLGKVHLEVGNAADAEKELRRAGKLGVVDEAILPLLARSLLEQGKYDQLQELSLANPAAREQKAVILAAQGLGMLVQGEVDAAAELVNHALSLDPHSVFAGVAKVLLLSEKRENEEARKQLDRVFAEDGDYALAWSVLGDLESRDNNLAKAEVAYTKAIEGRVNNLSDLLNRARIRVRQKKYEEAQEDINVLKKRVPNHAGVNFVQGLIDFQNNRLPEARDAFDIALRASNQDLQTVFYLSLTHLRLGNREQAEDYGNQFLSAVPGSIVGRKLMTTIALGNQEYAAAEELIRPLVAYREDDVGAINLLADALLRQKKTDGAIELLGKVASLEPDSAVAQLRLGIGLLVADRQDDGIEHIEKAIEMDPQLQQARIVLVQNYMNQKAFGKALATAEAYRDSHPDSAVPYNLIGRLHLVSGQEAAAAEAFIRTRELKPGDPEASHSLAGLAVKKKAYQQAREYYQEVLDHHENHLSTLLKLAVLDGVEKKAEQAMVSRLEQAAAAHPEAVQPKVILARYHLTQGKPTQVSVLMLELSETQKNIPAVLEVTALSQLALKQFLEAKFSLEQLIEQQPESALAHFLLAQAFAGLGDRTALKRELETVVELAPGYFNAHLAYARLLLLEGEKEKLTEQMVVLNELSPDHPGVVRLKAVLAQVEGDQETASALLDEVFEKSPSTASMLSAAGLKWSMGDQMAALELQEQWTAEHPDDLVASLALADTYQQQDQLERAIIQYQQVLEKDKQNVDALNNFAWALRNKQPAKALEYAERARALAPESAMVMDTYAVVLLKNGDIDRAKRSIERALAKDPKNPAFRYHGAMIDAAAGQKASAIRALEILLGEDSNFFEKKEARQFMAELKADG